MAKSKHHDLNFIVDPLDWDKNVNPNFKDKCRHSPITSNPSPSPAHAKNRERARIACRVRRPCRTRLCRTEQVARARPTAPEGGHAPLTELIEDEYCCTEDGAIAGVTFENPSETEPLVTLRCFGSEVNPGAPTMDAYRKNKFN